MSPIIVVKLLNLSFVHSNMHTRSDLNKFRNELIRISAAELFE